LWLTGRTLNIFSMIGMIMLMGLVTKNAILLVDYTNLLRRSGMSRYEAQLKAGPVRLRPILMTAFSTVAGMIPVAIGLGAGAETRAPMGTAIVGGMLTSTLLTLIVVPVVYSLLDDMAAWLRSWFVRKPKLKVMPKPTRAPVDNRPAAFAPSEDILPVTDVPAGHEAVSS
jgi:HAE1 family hydrophobic/amphiphilic exporter-1